MVYWWETLCTEGWLVMADRESGLLSLQNITNWWFWSDFWSPAENQMGKEKAILPMFVSLWCLTFVTKTNKKRGGRDSTKRLLLARWVSELQSWHVCNRIQSHPSEWLQMPGVWALWCFFFFLWQVLFFRETFCSFRPKYSGINTESSFEIS